jgi:hypothetical protein
LIDIAQSIQKAIVERNYAESAKQLDLVIRENHIISLTNGLKAINAKAEHLSLELRDHLFSYLEMWDIYFAVQMTSVDILLTLDENSIQNSPQLFMIEFIKDLTESKDSRFSQFCVNISTISKGHYAVLVPPILDQRMEELEKCKIMYRENPSHLYSTADLLKTYYGNKIVSAIHGHKSFDIVVGESQFSVLRKSLTEAGLDIESMMVKLNPAEWDDYVAERRRRKTHTSTNGELAILHRVKSARSNIYSSIFRQQVAALDAISFSKTQLCNDILIDVAESRNHQMRRRAIKLLGVTGDARTMSFLAELMRNESDQSIRTETARAYSALVSRGQLLDQGLVIPSPPSISYVVDLARINTILNALIARGMPTTMIDDTINSLAIQGGPKSIEILMQLLSKPQISVKRAVIKASRLLENQSAALIVRAALKDKDPVIIELAEKELDSRWPDSAWN